MGEAQHQTVLLTRMHTGGRGIWAGADRAGPHPLAAAQVTAPDAPPAREVSEAVPCMWLREPEPSARTLGSSPTSLQAHQGLLCPGLGGTPPSSGERRLSWQTKASQWAEGQGVCVWQWALLPASALPWENSPHSLTRSLGARGFPTHPEARWKLSFRRNGVPASILPRLPGRGTQAGHPQHPLAQPANKVKQCKC